MRKKILDNALHIINKYYHYDNNKLLEIKYGLETLYITLSKTLVILLISYLIGTIKETILLFIFFGLLRVSGFGMHAKKSWHCWILSILIFILFSYISTILIIPFEVKTIASITLIFLIYKYAPADTEDRPLINKKRRLAFKILCLITAFVYFILILFLKNNILSNILLFSMLTETLLMIPISYKIFKLKYNNYLFYKKS